MNDFNIKLSPKDILDKKFSIDARGYRLEEVDTYLDMVMDDYREFGHIIKEQKLKADALVEENNRLKNELRKLQMEFDTIKEDSETGRFTSTNVDLLKRLSNLEKIVYGKNE